MDIKSFPEYIEFQTFSLCNANCTICPYKNISKKLYDGKLIKLDMDCIKKLIDEIAKHKKEVKRVIPYLNNEPFLDNRIIEILRYIKSKGLFVEVSTNASNLNNRYAEKVINEKLIDELRISFFSAFPETYKKVMPSLQYNEVVKNINYFLDYNVKKGKPIDVEIIQVMYEGMNYEAESKRIKELFKDTRYHYFGYLDRAGNCKEKNKLFINKKEEKKLAGCSLRRLEDRFVIGADGDVITCSQDWIHEEVIGNVYNNSIKSIWNSKERKELLDKLYGNKESNIDFICNRCKLVNLNLDGNIRLNFEGDNFMSADGTKIFGNDMDLK